MVNGFGLKVRSSMRSAEGARYESQGASAEQSEARRPWSNKSMEKEH
jgi:hypothetical protein